MRGFGPAAGFVIALALDGCLYSLDGFSGGPDGGGPDATTDAKSSATQADGSVALQDGGPDSDATSSGAPRFCARPELAKAVFCDDFDDLEPGSGEVPGWTRYLPDAPGQPAPADVVRTESGGSITSAPNVYVMEIRTADAPGYLGLHRVIPEPPPRIEVMTSIWIGKDTNLEASEWVQFRLTDSVAIYINCQGLVFGEAPHPFDEGPLPVERWMRLRMVLTLRGGDFDSQLYVDDQLHDSFHVSTSAAPRAFREIIMGPEHVPPGLHDLYHYDDMALLVRP